MIWYCMIWFGMVWFGMVQYGIVWYGDLYLKQGGPFINEAVIQRDPVYTLLVTITIQI